MSKNAVTLNATLQVIKYGASDFSSDGTFNGLLETFHADVGPLVPGVPIKYNKVVSGALVEMTSPEKAVVDAAELSTGIDNNVDSGFNNLLNIVDGVKNTVVGSDSLQNIDNGNNNVVVGNGVGNSLTSDDSDNILLSNAGTSGDNGEIRVGTLGIHTHMTIPQGVSIVGPQIATPTSGATVNILDDVSVIIINPAGLLALLTINMPTSPRDGQFLRLILTKNITLLTLNGSGNTILNPLGGLISGSPLSRTWYFLTNTWYP
jgi:hypothetical protein